MANDVVVRQLETQLAKAEEKFLAVSQTPDDKAKFAREMAWAMQTLIGNEFTAGVAAQNPRSLINAVVNVAATGLSLNPVEQLAYLVPRKGAVCLDIGYRGIIQAATDTGRVVSVHADVICENDIYEHELRGDGVHFRHAKPRFGQPRGAVIGAYCHATLPSGRAQVTDMSLEELEKVRKRAPSGEKENSAWKTDREQMQIKTVIRRGSKQWPKGTRLPQADTIFALDAAETIDLETGEILPATASPTEPTNITPAKDDAPALEPEVTTSTGIVIPPSKVPADPLDRAIEIANDEEPTELVSKDQADMIAAALEAVGVKPKAFCDAFRIEKIMDLEASRYDAAMQRINEAAEKREQMKKEKATAAKKAAGQ